MSLAYKDSTHPEFQGKATAAQNEIPEVLGNLHQQLDELGNQIGYLIDRIAPVTAPYTEDVAEPVTLLPTRTTMGRALMEATDKVARLRILVSTVNGLVLL